METTAQNAIKSGFAFGMDVGQIAFAATQMNTCSFVLTRTLDWQMVFSVEGRFFCHSESELKVLTRAPYMTLIKG